MKRLLALLLGLLPAACNLHAPAPHPRYVLGKPYQADGVWHYPRAREDAVMTGLAAIAPSGHPPLTANGEAFDQSALAASSRTLQLPAIARLTNLANGRQIEVRINDRGPANPARLTLVTRRVASLLGFPPSGVARVRLRVLPGPSQRAADGLAGAPHLAVARAPVAAVMSMPLGPPGRNAGATFSAPAPGLPASAAPAGRPAAGTPAPALLVPVLSPSVTQVAAAPGALYVRLNTFTEYQYAAQLQARLAGLHPAIVRSFSGGEEKFTVRIGPFAHVAPADAALSQAIRAGVPAARIVVR